MAKALITSVALSTHRKQPVDDGELRVFQAACFDFRLSAGCDQFGQHQLVVDPDEADVIIFVERGDGGFREGWQGAFAERLREHPWVKRYREKSFVFDREDYSIPFLPGLYTGLLKKHYDPARTRTGYYAAADLNPYIDYRPLDSPAPYLATFVGSLINHQVRAKLANLPQDKFLVINKGVFGANHEERHRLWSSYADAMAAGMFSLCPRGGSPATIRVFESMRMGRCPVILADEWVFPQKIDWKSCAIVVPEKQVQRLPEILESKRSEAIRLGTRARQEWEQHYSPSVQFHWLVETCLELMRERRLPEQYARLLAWRHLFHYYELIRFLFSKRNFFRAERRLVF